MPPRQKTQIAYENVRGLVEDHLAAVGVCRCADRREQLQPFLWLHRQSRP
eukprot:SAG31_NODE_1405_length_8488_cov_2.786029_8_plen_50_part_00